MFDITAHTDTQNILESPNPIDTLRQSRSLLSNHSSNSAWLQVTANPQSNDGSLG